MTLIQPNKNNKILNALLVIFGVATTGAVICLIFLYNQTVSLSRGASLLEDQTVSIQAENSELKSDTFALLDPYHLANLASAQGMTSRTVPNYVSIPTWVAASHF